MWPTLCRISVHRFQLINLSKNATVSTPVFLTKYVITSDRVRYAIGGRVFQNHRNFHVTQVKYLHPLLWTIIRPFAKFSAILVGRGLRKWWGSLPANKRTVVIAGLKKHKFKILGFLGVSGGLGILYYETHLQEAPITKRKRFIAFNLDQIVEFADFQHQLLLEEFENQKLAGNNIMFERVQRVIDRIIKSNHDISEIKDHNWTINVIDTPVENVFVLPNGQIYIHRGMLNQCINDDQLAIILAHEMAHAILYHGAEQMSYFHLLDFLTIFLITTIWALLPSDVTSAVVQWLMRKILLLVAELPYSRNLETEADEIGLYLAAKACVDVREGVAFWKRLHDLQQEENDARIEFLSTHPAHETRSNSLEERLPKAIELRQLCNCPSLPAEDPRKRPLSTAQLSEPIINVVTSAR